MRKLTVEVWAIPVTSSVTGLKLGLVISRGTLTASSLTVPVKPFLGVTVTVAEAVIPCHRMKWSGEASTRNSGVGKQLVDPVAWTALDRPAVATKHNRPIRIGPFQVGLRVGFQLDDSLGDRAGDKAWALHSLSSSDLALPSKWGLT